MDALEQIKKRQSEFFDEGPKTYEEMKQCSYK